MRTRLMMAALLAVAVTSSARAELVRTGEFLGSGQFIPNATHVFVDGVNALLEATPLDVAQAGTRHQGNDMFRAMDGPFAGFAPSASLGFDDYQGISPPGDADGFSQLQEFGFIGGVTTPGMTLQFQFFNAAQTLVNFFNITFAMAGNFNYTLTNGPDTHPPFSPPFFEIPNSGFVQIVAAQGSTGQWFLATAVPTIGTESRSMGQGSLTTHSHRFRLDVPEPTTLALLGIGGLILARRRR